MNSKCCNSKIQKDYLDNKRCSHCLLVTKSAFNFKFLYIGLALLSLMTFAINGENSSLPKIHAFHLVLKDSCDIETTDSCILRELINDSCVLPTVAIAQSKLETGNYKSTICKSNKNLFGIKYHKCKYVSGTDNGHATFNTYKDCIKCYCHIQKMYLKSIDGKYAENPGYINLIKKM